MAKAHSNYSRRIVTLALGLGVMVLGAELGEDGMTAQAGNRSVRCEIRVEPIGAGVQLQGVVFASKSGQGAYELNVSKSNGGGRSNIKQAGDFDAQPNRPAKLGIIQLGGDGGSYHAKLRVTWDGEEIECEKTVGGGWL